MSISEIFFRKVPSAVYTATVTAGLNIPPETFADMRIPTNKLNPTAKPALVKL